MTAIQIIGLVLILVALSSVIGYLFQAGKPEESQEIENSTFYTEEELENAKLAEELYNKDLRPIAVKQVSKEAKEVKQVEVVEKVTRQETKSEHPIDSPKKKRKYYPKKNKA